MFDVENVDPSFATDADEAAEEAAFNAVLNGEEVDPQEPIQDETPTGEEPAAATPETPAQEAPQYVTAAELAALKAEFTKGIDKSFGKMGELQQKIDAAATRAAGFSAKAKERLVTEFPELAEILFEQGEAEPAPQAHQSAAAPNIEDLVQSKLVEKEQILEKRLLKRDHPDWETVVSSDTFAEWRDGVLDPEAAAELQNSWDADFVSGKITEYKAWQKAKAKKDQQSNRLESAVVPQGLPRGSAEGYEDDEEAAMLKAFGRK